MISLINNTEYNNIRLKKIGGLLTGIWKNPNVIDTLNSFPLPKTFNFSSVFSDFEKFVGLDVKPMSYHLCGYGTFFNESICGFLGESVERYSFASLYKEIGNAVCHYSINEIKNLKEEAIFDLNYLNIFSDNNKNNLQLDEKISWIKMNYLNDYSKKLYVPLQFFVSATDEMIRGEKRFLNSAVSTGTACQESFFKALEAAIIEIEQIDSFNLWWYGGLEGKDIKVNICDFLEKYFSDNLTNNNFVRNFEVVFTDISFDKNLDVVVCEIFSKNKKLILPKYTVGVQGAKNMSKAIYRSFMEALAVLSFNFNYPWIYPEKYKNVKENQILDNLDVNITWYSKFGKPNKVKHNKKVEFLGNKDYDLIKDICKFGKTGFMNISLPEFESLNLAVARVVNPALLSICIPSYPTENHPRYKEFGGILNFIPHPLA